MTSWSAEFIALPAFLVQGLRRSEHDALFQHPITGMPVGCPDFAQNAAIVQVTSEQYEKLIKDIPEACLKYVDNDGDVITVSTPSSSSIVIPCSRTLASTELLAVSVLLKSSRDALEWLVAG